MGTGDQWLYATSHAAMDSSTISTPEHTALDVDLGAGVHDEGEASSLALIQASSQDQAQAQSETQVEVLPQGRTALLDYDLEDWELATLHSTRTRYGQHDIGWVFEQVLGKMTPGIVSQSDYCL
jgi:hypothetical protein